MTASLDAPPLLRPGRASAQDISDGTLNTLQRIAWPGSLPVDAAQLATEMERLHFRQIERSTAHIIRCRREGDAWTCSAFGRQALGFASPEVVVEDGSVICRWQIQGGMLARYAGSYGAFELGMRQPEGGTLIEAWASVTAYPSRFLLLPDRPARFPQRSAARFYCWYHERVTFQYLEALRRSLANPG